MKRVLFVAIALSSAACASVPREHKEALIDRDGIDVVGAPADRLHILVRDLSSKERFCKGPGPDFSSTGSSGFEVASATTGLPVGGSLGTQSGTGAVVLGGRSPAVLLARELFYRTCELIVNNNLDAATALSIYKATMDSVERIASVQLSGGSAPASANPPPASITLPQINITTVNSSTTTIQAPDPNAQPTYPGQ